jgi:glycosyltransferase involved in cell wall biosynthesis
MQAEPCRVSVVIPLYNSAATLRRAVASALAQSLRDIEVLIVDDGSRDDSLSLAQQLAAEDPRVRVIALPENRGKPHAMNVAFAAARGTWTAVLDADDWYAPERLETLVTAGSTMPRRIASFARHFRWKAGTERSRKPRSSPAAIRTPTSITDC